MYYIKQSKWSPEILDTDMFSVTYLFYSQLR